MNEQQLADLFSEQVDRLLQGEAPTFPAEAGEVPELLNLIGQPISSIQFQPSPTAQAAFQSQLTSWFGLINGGSNMAILGLSKAWFITILISIITVVVGTGFIAIVVTSVFIATAAGPASPTVPAGTGTAAATAVASTTVTTTAVATTTPTITATAVATTTPTVTTTVVATTTPTVTATTTITPQPTVTSTVVVSGTPVYPPIGQIPSLIFITDLSLVSLCQGTYITQRTLVNYSQTTITNAALGWEVIEGPDLVDQVSFTSPDIQGNNDDDDDNNVSVTGAISNTQANYETVFNPIPAGQKVKVDIKVKVKDKWWKEENGTQIKVKVSIKSKGGAPGHSNHHQVITIVKQGSQWVTLKGIAHFQGNQGLLIDGHIIKFNNCTGFPPTLPAGSQVEVIGILQPDGTFIAIHVIIINVTIIVGDFDSGVPVGGGDSDGGSGGGGSKGGGGKGGSKGGGGKGGSKGGGGGSGGSGGS